MLHGMAQDRRQAREDGIGTRVFRDPAGRVEVNSGLQDHWRKSASPRVTSLRKVFSMTCSLPIILVNLSESEMAYVDYFEVVGRIRRCETNHMFLSITAYNTWNSGAIVPQAIHMSRYKIRSKIGRAHV